MLRGAAPVNGGPARGLVPVEEPTWSRRSPQAEIRVVDGTHFSPWNASETAHNRLVFLEVAVMLLSSLYVFVVRMLKSRRDSLTLAVTCLRRQ